MHAWAAVLYTVSKFHKYCWLLKHWIWRLVSEVKIVCHHPMFTEVLCIYAQHSQYPVLDLWLKRTWNFTFFKTQLETELCILQLQFHVFVVILMAQKKMIQGSQVYLVNTKKISPFWKWFATSFSDFVMGKVKNTKCISTL